MRPSGSTCEAAVPCGSVLPACARAPCALVPAARPAAGPAPSPHAHVQVRAGRSAPSSSRLMPWPGMHRCKLACTLLSKCFSMRTQSRLLPFFSAPAMRGPFRVLADPPRPPRPPRLEMPPMPMVARGSTTVRRPKWSRFPISEWRRPWIPQIHAMITTIFLKSSTGCRCCVVHEWGLPAQDRIATLFKLQKASNSS